MSKKFETTLLYAGITPEPSEASNAKQFGPTNNPGLDHMSQEGLTSSESGRTTAEAARSDAQTLPDANTSPKPTHRSHYYGWGKSKHNPHASVSPATTQLRPADSPTESPGVSPIPSASPSRPSATFVPGISPIPSAPENRGINLMASATATADR